MVACLYLHFQVEELYETYCIQWRLCQGAVNMKKAFALSPSSRASRESLQELNRNHRHSLEVLQSHAVGCHTTLFTSTISWVISHTVYTDPLVKRVLWLPCLEHTGGYGT